MHVGILEYVSDETLDVITLARTLEQMGFESLWLPEHPVVPAQHRSMPPAGGAMPDYYGRLVDPFVALSAAAAGTERLRLGTSVCLVPEHDVFNLAKAVATVDRISRGRLLVGIGPGWLREESALFNVDFPRRWRQTREHVLALKALWGADPAEFSGCYVNFPPVLSRPKPIQQPHPPLIIGGDLARAPERVAEYGDGWFPRARFSDPARIEQARRQIEAGMRERGRDPGRLTITLLGAPPERQVHRDYAASGVDRIVHLLFHEPPQQALQRLEEIAGAVL